MKFFTLLTLFLTPGYSFLAQAENAILQFNAIQVESRIQLDFSIKAGNTCNGISILHSTDSINFAEIGNILGICGSSDRNESYTFTDFQPEKNTTNYYRLQPGTLGISDIIGLFFISTTEDNALIFPNPATNQSAVYFVNTSHEEHIVSIFSNELKLVEKSSPSRGNSFPLRSDDLLPGTYFFIIENAGQIRYKGKFVVR